MDIVAEGAGDWIGVGVGALRWMFPDKLGSFDYYFTTAERPVEKNN